MIRALLRKFRHGLKDESGSDAVTFVLVIPLFMLIFALMVTFSQIIYAGSVCMNAANVGCRSAIVQQSKSAAASSAFDAANVYLSKSGMGVAFASDALTSDGGWSRGNVCTYAVTVSVRTIVPLNTFNREYRITKYCPMIIER